MKQLTTYKISITLKIVFTSVISLIVIIGLFVFYNQNDLPKIVRNTKIVINGNGDVCITESFEVDPDLDVEMNSLGFLTTIPIFVSNLKINNFPVTIHELIPHSEVFNGKKINFLSLKSSLKKYTAIDRGTLISWDIKYNIFTKHQKTMINTLRSVPLLFVKPIQVVSKKAKIQEHFHIEVRDTNFILGPCGFPESSKPIFRNFQIVKYLNEYIQETITNKKLLVVNEPYVILVKNDNDFEIYGLREEIKVESPDQIHESTETVLKIITSKMLALEQATNNKLDLTNPDIKVFIDGNQPTVIPVDDSTLAQIREGKDTNVKLFSYYYGKNSVPFDRRGKSILTLFPSNPNKIIKTSIDIYYNPQKVNEVIKLDEFNYLLNRHLDFTLSFRRNDDIVSVEIPKEYRFSSYNYSN